MIGCPIRIVISDKLLEKNCVEVKIRKNSEIKEVELNQIEQVVAQCLENLRGKGDV